MPLETLRDYLSISYRPPLDHMITMEDITYGLQSVLCPGGEHLNTRNIYLTAVGGVLGVGMLEQALRDAQIKINTGEGPVPVMILVHFGIHFYSVEVSPDGTKLVDLRDTPRTLNSNQGNLFVAVSSAIARVNTEIQAAIDAEMVDADAPAPEVFKLKTPDKVHFRNDFEGIINMPAWDGTSCGHQQLSFFLQRRGIDNAITQAADTIALRTAVENLFLPEEFSPLSYPRYLQRYRERDLAKTILRFDRKESEEHPIGNLREYRKRMRAEREKALAEGQSIDEIYDFRGLHPGVRDIATEFVELDRAMLAAGDPGPCVPDDDNSDRALAIALQEEEFESIRIGSKLRINPERKMDRLRRNRHIHHINRSSAISSAEADSDVMSTFYDDLGEANPAVLAELRNYLAIHNSPDALVSDEGDMNLAYAMMLQEQELANSVPAARLEAKKVAEMEAKIRAEEEARAKAMAEEEEAKLKADAEEVDVDVDGGKTSEPSPKHKP